MSWLATWPPAEREAWEREMADRRHMFACRQTFDTWRHMVTWPITWTNTGWRRAPGSGR